ncbi:MAG: transcription elongation factor GreA [Mycoplasmataceae bacterium]|jgi:transcription elongation factor GreA|nr:transcription elongation factor GreA [Mycoplasmataceae bacterium]
MEKEKSLLTQEGKEKLEHELRELIDVKRPATIKTIQEAREQGDLSENADYDAAKNRQAEIEGRIKEIQAILDRAEIITENSKDDRKVKVGSKVTVLDLNENEEFTYEIVGEVEADPDQNKISNLSPLAKSILNKTIGTIVEVHGIEDSYKIKIKKIEN